jgi:hypothetical protein
MSEGAPASLVNPNELSSIDRRDNVRVQILIEGAPNRASTHTYAGCKIGVLVHRYP